MIKQLLIFQLNCEIYPNLSEKMMRFWLQKYVKVNYCLILRFITMWKKKAMFSTA